MTDDLEQRLTELGNAPTPPPDPGFADGLESSLRVLVAGGATGGGLFFAARRLGRWPITASVATFAAVVLVFGLTVVRDPEPQQIFLVEATEAEVVLPSGQRFEAFMQARVRQE